MAFNPHCKATAIGSFPHKDPAAACDLIFSSIPEIPIWPQLPNIDFREQMDVQYCEGLPRIVLQKDKKKIYFDTKGDFSEDLEKFYSNFMEDNLDYFNISPSFGSGIYQMEKKLHEIDTSSIIYFKNQVVGPVTFGLSVMDESNKSIYYNEIFRDVIVKAVIMKARWLLRKFNALFFNQICFIDEPILSAFGSSTYLSVQRPDVVKCLNEVVDAVHKDNVLTGTHCCGNTDWTILIDAGVDIISFDAYEYGETISYYPDNIKTFPEKGGALAWGIVPTSSRINNETPDTLVKKLKSVVKNLSDKGIDKNLLWERCLLTPSCGTGSVTEELSKKVMNYLYEVSSILQK
jgi:methionine synthase II (cobalamin-independent)